MIFFFICKLLWFLLVCWTEYGGVWHFNVDAIFGDLAFYVYVYFDDYLNIEFEYHYFCLDWLEGREHVLVGLLVITVFLLFNIAFKVAWLFLYGTTAGNHEIVVRFKTDMGSILIVLFHNLPNYLTFPNSVPSKKKWRLNIYQYFAKFCSTPQFPAMENTQASRKVKCILENI